MLKQRTKFTYEPLDTTQQSIRLISVDPELSPEGFVQCSIRHTTIDAQYNCLSYRWGPPDLSNTLIINGQALSINGYLHDFLAEVRTFTYQAPNQSLMSNLRNSLWIDAVCIDQKSTIERNHQVGQMGKIYSNACKVIMWLGNRYSEHEEDTDLPSTSFKDYYGFILYNQYWTRAWVAQEIMLAKDPVLMIADHIARRLVPFTDLFNRRATLLTQGLAWDEFTRHLRDSGSGDVLLTWKKLVYDRKDTAKKPEITEWLRELQNVKCTLVRDRIFSLLELSKEGRHITVDYNMSIAQLVYQVLSARNREVCLCEIFFLNWVLKIGNEPIDTSGACTYVQLVPNKGCFCTQVACDWQWELDDPNDFDLKILQAPLQAFQIDSVPQLCFEAIHGDISKPVQVKIGSVYERQLVSKDGKIKKFPFTTAFIERREGQKFF
ncbi:hypothetical protein E8E13_006490 [Curvularia kusanoi]|uniref:Heterokaryon incompatibility domain-containing protein n=1 Tax=Curvularia kusanoi TaxID=90978 RepID=A0A9P4TGD5_CURKU|nr:hypothetical protein E8E13_006490 [Curvularia kusanoi]